MDSTTFARRLRREMTEPEQRLWSYLRRRNLGGHRFRRQFPIGDYVVDFVCLRQRLIVEVDGSQHAEREVEDAVRTAWLVARGFRVIRFWNYDVMSNIEGVCEEIDRCLRDEVDDPPS